MNKREVLCPKMEVGKEADFEECDRNFLPFSYLDFLSFQPFFVLGFPTFVGDHYS